MDSGPHTFFYNLFLFCLHVNTAGNSVNSVLLNEIRNSDWVLQWWSMTNTIDSKIVLHNNVVNFRGPRYVAIFPVYLRMAPIFTDVQQYVWLRPTFDLKYNCAVFFWLLFMLSNIFSDRPTP